MKPEEAYKRLCESGPFDDSTGVLAGPPNRWHWFEQADGRRIMAVTPWRHHSKTFEKFIHPDDLSKDQNAGREDDDRCPHCGKSWEEIPNICFECYSSKTPTKPLEGDFDFF